RVKVIFDEYIVQLKSVGKKYSYYASTFYNKFVEYMGNVYCDQVDSLSLKRFQRHLVSAGLAKSTVDRHFAMYKAAWKFRFGDHGPFKQVKMFRPDNTLVRWLSADEEMRLLEACKQSVNPELYGMVVVAINTGLRARNIADLRWDQVDLERAVVTVMQKGARRLVVPLNGAVRSVLMSRPRDSEYIFRNAETMAPYVVIPRRTFARAKKAAGIDRPFRFHDLRHHFATKIATVAGSLGVVRDLMGHSDLSVSGKYLHVIDGARRNAVEKLNKDQEGRVEKAG
ncbi:MAG: tyrosine-type recombinase/integrase, partial [Desulfomonilaceae bacterium]